MPGDERLAFVRRDRRAERGVGGIGERHGLFESGRCFRNATALRSPCAARAAFRVLARAASPAPPVPAPPIAPPAPPVAPTLASPPDPLTAADEAALPVLDELPESPSGASLSALPHADSTNEAL